MNFKRKALGLVAALGLSLSIAAPALADVTAETGDVTVILTEGGVFEVSLTGTNLTPSGDVSAISTGVTATGQISINYLDTKSFRSGFDTSLQADDFTSTLPIPLGTTNYGIDAGSLIVTKNWDAEQCRWSSASPSRIGDIGPTSNGADNDHSGGGTQDWTGVSHALANLGVPQLVGFGFKGPGTASSSVCLGSQSDLDLKLTVPDGQPATTYTSVLHVTVTFNSSIP